jgi:hypothetical protein
MRLQGDPMADKAAAALFDAVKGSTEGEVAAFITAFISHDFAKKWANKTLIPDPLNCSNILKTLMTSGSPQKKSNTWTRVQNYLKPMVPGSPLPSVSDPS